MAAAAQADPNDLALNRLSFYNAAPNGAPPSYQFQGGCGTPTTMFAQCQVDNQLFVNLITELGTALAPPLLSPPGTLGYNGLSFGYAQTITGINSGAADNYWGRGTEGYAATNQPGGNAPATLQTRNSVPGQLFVSHFIVRKSFPFGFDLGMHVSYLHDSTLAALGLDIRWALFEGFRHGIGYLPEFAVRASVNTMVGNPQLYLTIVGLDATIGWKIPIAGVVTLSPYIGGQALMIFGDSTVIDGTPTRSSYAECTRRHVHYYTDMNGPESELVCDSSAPGQVNPMPGPNDSRNEMVFLATRTLRTRAMGGLQLRIANLFLGGEFLIDVIDPRFLNPSNADGQGRPSNDPMAPRPRPTFDMTQQWQVSWTVGVRF
jgi:hypothetical protein